MLYVIFTLLLLPLLARRPRRADRILIVQTAKIGDLIMSTSLLGSLRASFPNAHITVLHQPLTTGLTASHPWIDARIVVAPGQLRGLGGKLSLARRLRGQQFDAAIVLSPGAPILVALAWAGIPLRLAVMPIKSGSTMRLARRLLTGAVLHSDNRPLVESYLDLVRLLGGTRLGGAQRVVVTEAPPALAALAACTIRVGIGISAANSIKSLGDETLAAICREITGWPNTCAVLIGGPEDTAKAARVRALASSAHVIDLSGCCSLAQLPAVIEQLHAFVGVDSGVTHMADALGVPQVVVSGPVKIVEVMPRTAGSSIVPPPPLACAPCSTVFCAAYTCATGTHACVRLTDPAGVVRALSKILAVRGLIESPSARQ